MKDEPVTQLDSRNHQASWYGRRRSPSATSAGRARASGCRSGARWPARGPAAVDARRAAGGAGELAASICGKRNCMSAPVGRLRLSVTGMSAPRRGRGVRGSAAKLARQKARRWHRSLMAATDKRRRRRSEEVTGAAASAAPASIGEPAAFQDASRAAGEHRGIASRPGGARWREARRRPAPTGQDVEGVSITRQRRRTPTIVDDHRTSSCACHRRHQPRRSATARLDSCCAGQPSRRLLWTRRHVGSNGRWPSGDALSMPGNR